MDLNSLEMNWVNSKVIPRLSISGDSQAVSGCSKTGAIVTKPCALLCKETGVQIKANAKTCQVSHTPAKYAKTLAQPMQLGSVIEFNHSRQNTGVFE